MSINSNIESALTASDSQVAQLTSNPASDHAAALALSTLHGFSGFTTCLPAGNSQGVLECVYELQQLSCSISALEAASLVSLSRTQAIFACLSMVNKYHQRKKQARGTLLLCADQPDVIAVSKMSGFEVKTSSINQLEHNLDSRVAAIILNLPSVGELEPLSEELAARLDQMDVLVLRNGCRQYLLPAEVTTDNLRVDLMCLDLAHLCETEIDCFAVLANKKLSSYLPAPRVELIDNQYRLQTQLQNPLTIGPLNAAAGNVESIIQCYVQLRLKGISRLQQYALKALVSAVYVTEKLTEAGFQNSLRSVAGSGECDITFASSEALSSALQESLQHYSLSGMKIDEILDEEQGVITLRLGRLHYLSKKQLDSLVELITNL